MSKIVAFPFILLIICSCIPTGVNSTSSSTTDDSRIASANDTSNTEDAGSQETSASCTAQGVGDSSLPNYYSFPEAIIAHGPSAQAVGIGNIINGTGVVWSSLTGLSTTQRYNLVTDGILKIRVLAKPNPGRITSLGCMFEDGGTGAHYTKLRIKIRVRALTDTSDYDTRESANIAVGDCSEPLEFSVPVNSLQEPFVVEVLDVYNDLACIWSGGEGYGCPMSRATQPDCVQFELQLATSHTKDFY